MKNSIMIPGIISLIILGCNTGITPTPSSSPTVSPTPEIKQKGVLEGRLTIGPLCPVEPCNISDEQKRLAYVARKIQVYMLDKKTLVAETTADYKTEMFRMDLPVGRYSVTVTNGNLNNFEPKDINIEPNKTTTLNLDVDTGIR
jgi:hypothetical protein